MDTIADYNAWKSKQQESGVGAAQVVLGSVNEKPDQVAGDLNLANEFGKTTGNPVPPLPMVKEYRNVFQQKIEEAKNKTILSSAPRLTDWLRNPDNAALARDDLANLSWWDKLGRNIAEVPKGVPGGAVSAAGTAMEGAGQLLTPANPAPRNAIASAISRAQNMKPDEIAALRQSLFAQGDVNPQYAQSVLSDVISGDMTPADAIEALGPMFAPALKAASDALQSGGEKTQEFGQSILPAAPGMEDSLGRQVGSGLGSLLTILAVGLASGGTGAAAFGGAMGAGEAASNARQAGADEDTQTIAAVYGILPGMTDAIPVERLLSSPVKAGIAAFLRSVGLQAAIEGGQEAVQQIMQNAISQNLYAPDKSLMDQVADNFAAGGIVGALVEAGKVALHASLPGRYHKMRRSAEKAPETQQKLAEISAQAQASQVRARTPDTFRQFVETATANGPVENVYVPAEQFSTYFQGIGVDPYALVDQLEGVSRDDLDVALAGGGDLKIPTATYAAKIAGSEHDAFLMENMRFDPNEFTAAEAKQFNEHAQDALDEAWHAAETMRQEQEGLRSFETQIYDTMVSRLREAGRSTDVATTEAALYPAFYRTMAERSGQTVEDFMRAYPLPQVRGSLPEGMQFRDVDALNRTLAEARAQRSAGADKRQSLAEFISNYGGINDVGGEIKAMDAAAIKRKGKKTLKLARGGIVDGVRDMFGQASGKKHGLDDVAQAAIEAGYLANDPVAVEYRNAVKEGRQVPNIGNALLDAISREMRGEPDYAGAVDAVAADHAAQLDQIEAYLNSLGVSLDDSDAAIRDAVQADQADEGRKYGQAGDITATEAFKKWFGDSKVVDASGKPLVVYHGTAADVGADFAFDPSKIGQSATAEGYGFYFTSDRATASGYQSAQGGSLVEAYLKMEKPLPVDSKGFKAGDLKKIVNAMVASEIKEGDTSDYRDTFISNFVDTYSLSQERAVAEVARIVSNNETAIDQIAELANVAGNKVAALTAVRDVTGHDGIVADGYGGRGEGGGTIYVAWFPEQIKSVNNRGTFDPTDPRLLFQSGDVRGPRGLIQFPGGGIGNGDTVVRLFESADLSTFLHESGHYFLTVMRDLAAKGEASAGGDMETVKAWWRDNADAVAKDGMRVMPDVTLTADDVNAALANGTTGDLMKDAAVDVGMQEQWARGFESYLMEGKAPSIELRSAFEKFRSWLISVYRKLAGLNVSISDNVREVFDRMIASDQEIAQAKEQAGDSGPVFATAEQMGLTPGEFASFLKLRDQAEDDAKARLLREAMAPVKRAQEKWFKDERGKVREEVERDVNTYRYYRAWEWMGNRRWLGEGDRPEGMPDIRLSKQTLVERYGEGVLKTLPRGKQTIYAVEGGIDPDDAAGWFGFDSGDELVQALEKAPPRKDAIEAETDKIMRERHGDVLNDGAVEAAALDAIHSDKRSQWIAAELKAVVEVAGTGIGLTAKEARASARASVARMKVRDAMNSSRFLAAERKAADEAAKLGAMLAREGLWMQNARRRVATKARAAMRAGEIKTTLETEPPLRDGMTRVYHSGSAGEGDTGRWVSTNRTYAANYRADLPLFYSDIPAGDPRVNNPDYPEQGAAQGFTFNFELTPDEAAKLSEIPREGKAVPSDAVSTQIDRANASTGNYNETVARLVETKRRQLINHALYMESRNVADEVEKAENFVAKLAKKSTREKIAGAGRRENAQVDYLGAIDEILGRYDFRKLSGGAEDRRGALNAFVAAMTAAGRENELAIPEAVLSDAARRPYKTLPVEEMRGVIDSLKNLEHVALRWNKLIDAQKQRDLEAAVADIGAAFDANMPKRPPSRVGTKAEARRHSVRQFFDLVLNAGTLLREIDGFKDEGAAYRNIKTPIDEAMDRLIVRKQKAAGDLENLYAVYSKEDRRAMAVRKHIPELGYALSKWERIAVALNLGNEGNRSRLTDPKVRGSLTDAQVEAVIATLDARDAAFVQSVWDYVGSFRDDIAARERRATGVEPQWVEASPVEIAGKTLKGGYYPLKYDPRLSSLARDDEANNIAQSLQAGRFGKAQTRQGHLKERAKSSGRDIELDMSVLHRHVNQVIYDLELSEPVANSWRILQNGEIRSAFMDAGKQADFDALEIWLKDVAEGELKSADLVGRGARMLKSNFTAAKLAFNISTVAMQVTGLSQSMVVVGKKDMAVGIMQAAKNPISAARDIAAVSPFMAARQTTFNKDIFDFYADPKTGPVASRWGEIKAEIVGPLAFWMMTKTQWYLADVPTWLAGYRQGLRQNGNDEAKAIAHADAVVKRAQASGLFADRSAVERGSVSRTARQNDVVRLFTALGSYMFAKFNVAYERTAKAKRLIGDEGISVRSAQEALSWTIDMGFLFVLEAVVQAAIRGQLPSGDDDKEDGWLTFLAKQTGFSVMATIPGVRDVAGPLQGFDGGGSYGAITTEIAKPFLEGAKSVQKGEVRKQFIKSVIAATGLATGLPATQINRAVDAAWRESEGKDVSPLEYLLGKIGKK